MNIVQATFTTALDLIGTDKVRDLLEELGYNDEPTPALCMEILDREGRNFSIPFGKLLKEAVNTPAAKAWFLVAARKNKASGASTLTAEQKSNMGLAWTNTIADLFVKGLDSTSDILNATNGTNQTVAMAQYYAELRRQEEASQKTTLYWILGGIGVLLIVVIFIVALTKRN